MLDRKELEKLYRDCMEFWGIERQSRMLQEECAELIVAISHYLRERKGSTEKLVEELADVRIMSDQLIAYFGEDRVMEVVDRKSDRVKKKLEEAKSRRQNEDRK